MRPGKKKSKSRRSIRDITTQVRAESLRESRRARAYYSESFLPRRDCIDLFAPLVIRNNQFPSLSRAHSPGIGRPVFLSTGTARPSSSGGWATVGSEEFIICLGIWSCAGGSGDFAPGSRKGWTYCLDQLSYQGRLSGEGM